MSKLRIQQRRTAAQRRRRWITVIGVVVVVTVGVAGFIFSQSMRVPETARTVKALGPATAKVTVVVYSDFKCGGCGAFATGAEQQLIDRYVLSGTVRLEYRHLIVHEPEARRAAEASECANAQGQFWEYHDALFADLTGATPSTLTAARLKELAVPLELDTTAFNTCVDSQQFAAAVKYDEQTGRAAQIPQTPTVLVNGNMAEAADPDNPIQFTDLQPLIEAALSR